MLPSLLMRKQHQLTGHRAAIFALAPGPEVGIFLSTGGDGWIVAWHLANPATGRLLAQTHHQTFALTCVPDRALIIAGDMNGGVHWIDLANTDNNRDWAHHRKGVFALLPVDEYLYSVGGGGLLTRWSLAERRSIDSLHLSNQSLRCIDYSAARNELAVGSSDNGIYLLDADTLAVRYSLADAHDNSVFSLRYHPDGTHLVSGGRDAHLRIWQLGAGAPTPLLAQPAHWYTINAIAFSPDGQWLATASRDKTVKIWHAQTYELVKVLEVMRDGGHVNSVNALHWASPTQLLSAGDDRSIIIWESTD